MSDYVQWIKKAYRDYAYYFRTVWSLVSQERINWNWHIEYIANELQTLSYYVINRKAAPYDMIINIPPGMTKSTLVTQAWVTWLWLHDPSITVITSSYSSGLSEDNSMKAQRIIKSELYDLYNEAVEAINGEKIRLIKQTQAYWINNYGGFYYATSTGGTVTGKHASLIIRDDSLKPMDARFPRKIQEANDYNDKTLSTRKKDKQGTPTVTVMQRLHEEDPTGHDLKKMEEGLKIKHICLPASISDNVKPTHLKEYYRNGLLDENRLSWQTIENEKIRLGSVGYAHQYEQSVAPTEGVKINKNWFEYIDYSDLPGGLLVDMWIDGAYTKQSTNDPTGVMFAAYDKKGFLYIIHFESKYLELPELLKFIDREAKKLSYKKRIFIEPKASGLSLIQMLKQKENINPIKIKSTLVSEGKEARADTAAPKVEAGKVYLVRGYWNEEFTAQLSFFPHWKHDEAVDLLGYAVDYYSLKPQKKGIKQKN